MVRKFFLTGVAMVVACTALADDLTAVHSAMLAPSEAAVSYAPVDADGRYRYLISLDSPGLLARHQLKRGTARNFRWAGPENQQQLLQIRLQHEQQLAELAQQLGRGLQPSHFFTLTRNGFAVRLTPAEAAQLAALPGIAQLERERVYALDTFEGPNFIGAGSVWDGTVTPDGANRLGAGMVAGVLDSGIVTTHPAFQNDPACGHGVSAPAKLLSAVDCSGTDSNGLCAGASPGDTNGHGTHVAGTVAGNFLDAASQPAPLSPISGVAPCASIRSYKVCSLNGGSSCAGADILAGFATLLADGDVDTMNFSISGGNNPWSSSDSDRVMLDLIQAGVFVNASAGNSGPVTSTVSHRGPWVVSVAASTRPPTAPENFIGIVGAGPLPAGTRGVRFVMGSASPPAQFGSLPVKVDPAQTAGAEGCNSSAPFPANYFAGAMALIQRGSCAFTEKIENAFTAGAAAVIIWNNQAQLANGTSGQAAIPVYFISQFEGQAIRDYVLASNNNAAIEVAQVQIPPDTQAVFSSRGPMPGPLQNLQKPDITAPGVSIYAPYVGANGYASLSGTSMSGPHLSGAALLMRQMFPDWTPIEIGSALKMSASKPGFKHHVAEPWDWDDVGSGRVDLTRAPRVGLVMNETVANFLAADPAAGGDVRTLNLPALRDLDCSPSCTWTRTVRNTLTDPTSWSVSGQALAGNYTISVAPETFSFTGGLAETQTVTVTVSPNGNQSGAISFGEIVFVEATGQSPDLHWTLAVQGRENPPPMAALSATSLELNPTGSTATASIMLSNLAQAGADDLNFTIETAQVQTVSLGGQVQLADGPAQPVTMILDEGIVTLIGGSGVQQNLWVNQFTPAPLDLPFVLEQIQIGWAPGSGQVLAGDLYDVYVWSAPDRDPLGPVDLLASVTGVAVSSGLGFKTVNLPVPVSINAASGDVLIGVVSRELRANHLPIISDDGPSRQRSWLGLGFANGIVPDPPVFADADVFQLIDDFGFERNWTVRGFGTGGSACLNPAQVAWLSVSPDSGAVAAGSQQPLSIEINMSGQASGQYQGRVCIGTDDPDQPVLVVSLLVNHFDELFRDRFEQP